MEIELLSRGQAIDSAGIQQLARARMLRVIANIFHKQARLLGHLPFDYKGSFRDASARLLGRTEELSQHPAQAPTIAQFPRPWHLEVGLRAVARDIGCTGREGRAQHKRQITLARDRTDLPLYRRGNIGKPRSSRGSDVCNVGRHIKQDLQTGRNSEAPSGICAIDKSTAIAGTEIHPVLTLKTAHRHDEAGVRDVRPIRRDFIFRGWTRVRLCVDRAEECAGPKQTYLESSFWHGLPKSKAFVRVRSKRGEQPASPGIPPNP